jgi:hypothetical protein
MTRQKRNVHISSSSNHSKGTNKMSIIDQNSPKTYKLADSIIAAATDGTMSVDEIQHTIHGLTKLFEVKAHEDVAKKQRIKKMQAAQTDPKFKPIIARVNGELKRLGFDDINAFADKGDLKQLDSAIRAAKMDDDKRWDLKANMVALGLID